MAVQATPVYESYIEMMNEDIKRVSKVKLFSKFKFLKFFCRIHRNININATKSFRALTNLNSFVIHFNSSISRLKIELTNMMEYPDLVLY